LQYTASGIITLKQVSGLRLLKYNSINMNKQYIFIELYFSKVRLGCQPHAPAAFAPRKCFWYSFLLEDESIVRLEGFYVNEKFQ